MTIDPDHGFGLLRPEDRGKMEQILTERVRGSARCTGVAWNTHGLRRWT
jgi:hypothetical protein